jgi:SAM-dependent methyltransferase
MSGRRRGIPSSFLDEPSGALVWALHNWPRLTGEPRPASALDVGCGGGRNACFLAASGVAAVGVDYSEVALGRAQDRARGRVPVIQADLSEGLPVRGARFQLVCDLFVYKHLVGAATRAGYRKEIARVLRPDGRLLLSLAEAGDGYYAACPDLEGASAPRTVTDPVAGIASVLFSFEELLHEMSDLFALEMSWHKEKPGLMHGGEYVRRTMATIWRPATDSGTGIH